MEWMLMPLKRYAEFSGRSRRKEYWMFALGVFLLFFVLGIVMSIFVGGAAMTASSVDPAADPSNAVTGMIAGMGMFGLVIGIIWLGILIPSLAVGVRRLHDTDRSGWWLLAPIGAGILYVVTAQISSALSLIFGLAYLGLGIALFVFTVLPGTAGPNRFGEDPKGTGNAEVFA